MREATVRIATMGQGDDNTWPHDMVVGITEGESFSNGRERLRRRSSFDLWFYEQRVAIDLEEIVRESKHVTDRGTRVDKIWEAWSGFHTAFDNKVKRW